MTIRSVSYGGGVQSTALLVLAAQGYIDFPLFLFANVGDDSEHPDTLRYVREIAFDYAAAHGITIHELDRHRRDGSTETLWGRLMKEGSKSLPIPVRMPDTGAPGTRSCTADFKIRVVGRWLQDHGASAADPAVVAIGISIDEYQRAASRKVRPYEALEYPLLTLEWKGGVGLTRSQCEQVIRDAGLPVPPKSSCFFCPFHKPTVFADMRRNEPELFERAAFLEDTLNDRRSGMTCPGSGGRPAEARTLVAFRMVTGLGIGTLTLSDREALDWDPEMDSDVLKVEPLPFSDPAGSCPTCRARFDVDDQMLPEHERGPVYLTRFGKPLRDIFRDVQGALFEDPAWHEDEGYRCGDVCDT